MQTNKSIYCKHFLEIQGFNAHKMRGFGYY